MKILFIAAGGAIGSVLRYLASTATYRFFDSALFPWGTFFVNASGSFIIGLLWGLSEADFISSPLRTFLFIGLLGGYTTFSSFSLETMNLIRSGEVMYALMNFVLTNAACFALAFAGLFVARLIISFSK